MNAWTFLIGVLNKAATAKEENKLKKKVKVKQTLQFSSNYSRIKNVKMSIKYTKIKQEEVIFWISKNK